MESGGGWRRNEEGVERREEDGSRREEDRKKMDDERRREVGRREEKRREEEGRREEGRKEEGRKKEELKVKVLLGVFKEVSKSFGKIYTIENDNMIGLEICEVIFFGLSSVDQEILKEISCMEGGLYPQFFENILQMITLIKTEKTSEGGEAGGMVGGLGGGMGGGIGGGMSLGGEGGGEGVEVGGLAGGEAGVGGGVESNKMVNILKTEEILNQSGEQMLEISEISSVFGAEGLFGREREERGNRSKMMNVLDEYSFDEFQGSIIKRGI